MEREFVPGRYLHYKGNYYTAVHTVKHSETEELMVLYKPELSDQWWVRPLTMFMDDVTIEGKTIPRFQLISRQ